MIKYLYIYLALCFCGITVASCNEDEDTTPSMADTDRLETLIDTSNPDIMEIKEKYGTYMLYEFDQILDFAYQFEEASAWRTAEITKLDKADVPNAVSFLKENFLNCYNDEMLTTYLPRKLLLCGRIKGSTLGVSPGNSDNGGTHDAVANMNSMSIGELSKSILDNMSEERKESYIRQIHFIFLGGYIINARTHYFVENGFYDYGASLYSTLMDANRTQAKDLIAQYGEEYFYKNGFFPPENDEATYYGDREEDLIAFTKQLILMDETMYNTVMQYEMLRAKMQYVARGLQNMGVNVARINPLIANFL